MRLTLNSANTRHLQTLLNWLGDGTPTSDKKPPSEIKRAIRALNKNLTPSAETGPVRPSQKGLKQQPPLQPLIPAGCPDTETCFTHWARRYQRTCPIQFQDALAIAQELTDGINTVTIFRREVNIGNGDFVWIISPSWLHGFWLEASSSEAEARVFCQTMGWSISNA